MRTGSFLFVFILFILSSLKGEEWKETLFLEDESYFYFTGRSSGEENLLQVRERAFSQAVLSLLLYLGVEVRFRLFLEKDLNYERIGERIGAEGAHILKEVVVYREDSEVLFQEGGKKWYTVWVQIRYPKKALIERKLEEEEKLFQARGLFLESMERYKNLPEDDGKGRLLTLFHALFYGEKSGYPLRDVKEELLSILSSFRFQEEGNTVYLFFRNRPVPSFPVWFFPVEDTPVLRWTKEKGEVEKSGKPVTAVAMAIPVLLQEEGLHFPPSDLSVFQEWSIAFMHPLSLPGRETRMVLQLQVYGERFTSVVEGAVRSLLSKYGVLLVSDRKAPVLDLALTCSPPEPFAGVYIARYYLVVRLVSPSGEELSTISYQGGLQGGIGETPSASLRNREKEVTEVVPQVVKEVLDGWFAQRGSYR